MKLSDLPQPERTQTVHPDELTVDGDNPNEQSDEMFGLLCDNMRQKGWIGNHIVANTEGLIADGEHRWRAAQEIGLEQVPVKFYDIDDSERRLWRQELNKISGEHDTKRDALEYQTLLDNGQSEAVDELVNATGEDLDELLAEIRVDTSLPPAYEYDPEHNVYFEDCVEGMQERLEDDSVDMVFTSPPYNVEKTQGMNSDSEVTDYEDSWTPEEFRAFLSDVFEELSRVVKPSGHIFVNFQNEYPGGDVDAKVWLSELMPLPMRSYLVRYKGGGSSMSHLNQHGQFYPTWEPIFHFSEEKTPLNGTGYSDVWEHTPVAGHELDDTEDHPAPFPVELAKHAIQSATVEGDTILDPFMGSGTTAVAAIQNNRDYVGFELDEQGAYKPIIERRIGEAKRQMEANAD
jgi:16S rRNA G966 N2-methylase RsmD